MRRSPSAKSATGPLSNKANCLRGMNGFNNPHAAGRLLLNRRQVPTALRVSLLFRSGRDHRTGVRCEPVELRSSLPESVSAPTAVFEHTVWAESPSY